MSTAIFDLSSSIQDRVEEIQILIKEAREKQLSNEKLYNSLCRSISVLLASHIEGFIKDFDRSIFLDLNYHLSDFSVMPDAIKNAFCRKFAFYEGISSHEVDARVKQIIDFFEKNSVPVDMHAIRYKESNNKNSTAQFIIKKFNYIGIPNILYTLSNSNLESIFENNKEKRYFLINKLKKLRYTTFKFPYLDTSHEICFDFKGPKKNEKEKQTFWHSFLEEILTRRHNIAHGDTLENPTTWENLMLDSNKLEVFLYGITYATTNYISERIV